MDRIGTLCLKEHTTVSIPWLPRVQHFICGRVRNRQFWQYQRADNLSYFSSCFRIVCREYLPINCLRVELSASPVGCYCFMPLMDGKEMPDKHVGSLWYSQSREW